jgi:hypothetical protein
LDLSRTDDSELISPPHFDRFFAQTLSIRGAPNVPDEDTGAGALVASIPTLRLRQCHAEMARFGVRPFQDVTLLILSNSLPFHGQAAPSLRRR